MFVDMANIARERHRGLATSRFLGRPTPGTAVHSTNNTEEFWPRHIMTSALVRLKDRIGQQAPPISYVIDDGSIGYFADAIMDPDPSYRRDEAPVSATPPPLTAPPGFFGGATGLRGMPAGDDRTMSALDLPLPPGWPTLATGDEFEFHQPVRAGMTLIAQERLLDAYEKHGRSGRLLFYTIEKRFSTAAGSLVLRRLLYCAAREPLPMPRNERAKDTVREISGHAALPGIVVGPITVRYLAMFATATAEFVDIHYDADYARAAGLPGPIIQGLYKTALIGRMLKDWTGDGTVIRNLNVRHRGMDLAGTTLTVGGSYQALAPAKPNEAVLCQVWVRNQQGLITTSGSAHVAAQCAMGRAGR